ncbi:hypothetical protein [Nonomuraea jabiensis]|uniref:hypothetical protein n=1 Tax=Nonomuraea jabiensis TaxID=882448 RepID=UPI003D70C206
MAEVIAGVPAERGGSSLVFRGDAAQAADVVRRLLAGERGAVRDIVLLNAAALVAADGAPPTADLTAFLGKGVERAAAAVDSGAAADLLARWARATTRA